MPLTVLSGNPTGSVEEMQDMAVKVGNPSIANTPAPASYTGSATVTFTAADILGGIIVVQGSSNGAVTATLPIAESSGGVLGLAAALRGFSSRGVIPGDTIWCLIINGNNAANSITLAAGTGGSFDANQPAATRVIQANSSKEIAIRFTSGAPGAATYVIYC